MTLNGEYLLNETYIVNQARALETTKCLLSRVHTARGTAQLSSTDLLLSCAVPRGTAQHNYVSEMQIVC